MSYERSPALDPAAAELLLSVVESPSATISGEILDGYFTAAVATNVKASWLLEPSGEQRTATSLVDHDDEPVHLMWCADHEGYGYFSPATGWVSVPNSQLEVYRVHFARLFEEVGKELDWSIRGSPLALVPDLLWEVGDARIGRGRRAVSIWFGRRFCDQAVWTRVCEAARRRPTKNSRVLLTSTPAALLSHQPLAGHLVVSVRDVIDYPAGLAIRPDTLAALLDGPPPAHIHESIHLSSSGQQLVINGTVTINFKSDIQIVIVRRLVEAFKQGTRLSARELLDHAHSGAKTLRQAFGGRRWEKIAPYLKSENGLWYFDP